MDFNFDNNQGIFEPDEETPRHNPVNRPQRSGHSDGAGRPAFSMLNLSETELLGIGSIILEIILLFAFREQIFYQGILPLLNIIISTSAIAIYVVSLVLAAAFGFRNFIRRRRDRRY